MSRYSYRSRERTMNNRISCGCYSIILFINIFLGIWSVNYLLSVFFDKTIPIIGAFVIGLFVGQFTFPLAVIVFVLKYFGVL